MWSLDWFTARDLGRAIRRAAWPWGTWLVPFTGLWWLRDHHLSWRVPSASDFAEADFRARDWTDEPYSANICGTLPAHNTAPVTRHEWGDAPQMRPPPVPGFPDRPEEEET
jgi:hypothetical protein